MAQSGLIVRRSVRHEVVLPAKVRVLPEHAHAIRFAKGVTDGQGWIACQLMDFAMGGAGVVCGVFLPRGAAIELWVDGANESDPPTLQIRCRVMRTQMTDRRPAYLIGLAFTDKSAEKTAQIEHVLDRLDGLADGPEPTC